MAEPYRRLAPAFSWQIENGKSFMRKLLGGRQALSLFFFLLLIYAVYQAGDFDPAAQTLPLIVGIPSLVLSAVVLIAETVSQWKGKPRSESAMDGSRAAKEQTPVERRAIALRETVLLLWVVGLLALIWLIGLLWSMPLFLVLFLRLHAREPWKIVISTSLGAWAVVYLLFVQVLGLQLDAGYLQALWNG